MRKTWAWVRDLSRQWRVGRMASKRVRQSLETEREADHVARLRAGIKDGRPGI